jgi:hypothetical protein
LGWVSLSDSEDWTFKSRQGLRFPIYKGFTTTLRTITTMTTILQMIPRKNGARNWWWCLAGSLTTEAPFPGPSSAAGYRISWITCRLWLSQGFDGAQKLWFRSYRTQLQLCFSLGSFWSLTYNHLIIIRIIVRRC